MLIKNIRIVTPYEVVEDLVIRISHGKIVDINLEHLLAEDLEEEIIDGGGDYISPGFIDIYSQDNSGYNIMDSTEDALDKIGEYHLSNGVTSYLVKTIAYSYDEIIKVIENIVDYKNKRDKAKLIGIHLDLQFIHIGEKDIEKILKISKGKLKMVSLDPEQNCYLEIIEILKNNNVAVTMGNTKVTFESAKQALDQGVTLDAVLLGNLDCSTSSLQQTVNKMVNLLHIPIEVVVKMSTLNPAKSINMGREIGSIRVGKVADLIIFDENIKIKHCIIGGSLIW